MWWAWFLSIKFTEWLWHLLAQIHIFLIFLHASELSRPRLNTQRKQDYHFIQFHLYVTVHGWFILEPWSLQHDVRRRYELHVSWLRADLTPCRTNGRYWNMQQVPLNNNRISVDRWFLARLVVCPPSGTCSRSTCATSTELQEAVKLNSDVNGRNAVWWWTRKALLVTLRISTSDADLSTANARLFLVADTRSPWTVMSSRSIVILSTQLKHSISWALKILLLL